MTQRAASQRLPNITEGSRSLPIACHGAIRFLSRKNRFTTGKGDVYVCDSGCRTTIGVKSRERGMFAAATGFMQILDHNPIPLCGSCLKEAKLALAEIEEKIVIDP